MLGTTLWFMVAIGLLAGVVMDSAAAFGRAGVHAAADHALEAAMHDAVADYQNALQTAIAHDAPADANYAYAIGVLPNPLQRTVAANAQDASAGPRFTVAYAVTPTTLAAPVCPQAGPGEVRGADAIAWLQCGAAVRESRMSLHVVAQVLDAAGTQTLARRDQYVTLRLFAEPPYSAVVGRKDGAAASAANADMPAAVAHEGDLGGDTVSGTSPSPSPQPGMWPAGGTLIHVQYECHDGAGRCANAAPPDPDAQLRAGMRWTNGNQPAP